MDIREERKGTVLILSVAGRLDSTNSSELENVISEHINRGEKTILVNCERLAYVSSSGLRVLLMGLKKMQASQGTFALCSLQAAIKEIFDISGFTGIFRIYGSMTEAINGMA